MSSTEFNLDAFLSDRSGTSDGIIGYDPGGTEITSIRYFREQGYEGTIDYRVRQLSYSSLLTLHQCPRKFQLNRLRSTHKAEESIKSTVTFAFGHVVGEGIQLILEGKSEEEVIWKMFLGWHTDLANVDERDAKSFWMAVIAIQRFIELRKQGFLNDYELVYYNGRPACELSFAIVFPGGFRLRGFVDAVLRHKTTGEILVLECKTTNASTVNPAMYKNSSQAIGYSIVLDTLFPDLSSYKVLYLVYQTKSREYNPIPFTKSYLQRAMWIRELVMDIEMIEKYEENDLYPSRGESCFSFGRECEYFQTCMLSTQHLTKPCTPEEEDKTDYQVVLTLADLIDTQLAKAGE